MSHPFPIRVPRARLLVLLLCSLLTGCGALGRRRAPVDVSQDPRIRQQVEQRLAGEPSLRAGAVRVEVTGGVVTLHGSVHGIGAWQCALTTASLVHGVRTVADYLVIERGPRDVRCLAPRTDSDSIASGR